MRNTIGVLLISCLCLQSTAQDHELKSTVEIYQDLQEMQRGVRVLYLAAHPDDENTRLISWLENDQHIRTAYLSLTRGQGGQNLIGDEKGDALGVIRTYELLEARKIDGGEQFFTRAIDFGYSKSAEESFDFWGREEVLHDVVSVIRSYRPHIIITRFPPSRRAGHGHHEASGILAEEAFDLASDPTAFPEQLERLQPWQPSALYHNTSTWWDQSLAELDEEQRLAQKLLRVDIGVYNDLMGMGINEIASLARSKHRCQAFGTPRQRGQQFEYLQYVKGEWGTPFYKDFQGVWRRSPEHAAGFQRMIDDFDFTDREKNMAALQRHIYPLLAQRSMWAEQEEMQEVMQKVEALKLDLVGLRVEVFASESPAVVRTAYPVTIEVYNSGEMERTLTFAHASIDTTVTVGPGENIEFKATLTAPALPSNPFWVEHPHDGWLYGIDKATEVGLPRKAQEQVSFQVEVDGRKVFGATTVHRRWNDRSIGEIEEPLAIVQPVTLTPKVGSKVVRVGEVVRLDVVLKAHQDIEGLDVEVVLDEKLTLLRSDWPVKMAAGQERTVTVEFMVGELKTPSRVKFRTSINRIACDQMQTIIAYDHIPELYLHDPSEVEILPLALEFNPHKRILYVEGSGDEVDDALEELGYTIHRTSLNALSSNDLGSYDAVITGIRAFNRNDELAANMAMLNNYVKGGGKLIVQYNTTYDLKVEQIGPYPLKLSRDRVTDENSDVNLLKPEHPVFNTPNEMQEGDWKNWTQERGLYFAGEWDKAYTPLISWSDKDEDPVEGGLIVAEYGKGNVVYTGISFFRQLPAGVPGAYKLIVNLIEYE